MADASYQAGVYHKQGSNELVVGSDGQITVESGGLIEVKSGGLVQVNAGGLVTDATGAVLRYVDTVVSSAELLALNATPKTVVAAPGAGFANIFEGAILHKPAGTAYAAIHTDDNLSFKYTDGSGLEVAVAETAGFLDQTGALFRYVRAWSAASGVSSLVAVANAVLVLQVLNSEITTGDTAINVRVLYRVIPTTL